MASYQQKDLSGSLFKNDRKREGKKDADYTGSVVVEGRSYWLDCWVNNKASDPDHKPDKPTYMSLSLRPKDQPAERSSEPRQPRQPSRPAPRPPGREPDTGLHEADKKF